MNLWNHYDEKVKGCCRFCNTSYTIFTHGSYFNHSYTIWNVFSCPKCDRCVAVEWMNNNKWVKKIKVDNEK